MELIEVIIIFVKVYFFDLSLNLNYCLVSSFSKNLAAIAFISIKAPIITIWVIISIHTSSLSFLLFLLINYSILFHISQYVVFAKSSKYNILYCSDGFYINLKKSFGYFALFLVLYCLLHIFNSSYKSITIPHLIL